MSNNTPDYEDNLVFEPQGDQSDARVVFHTDRTALTIKLIDEIERLKKENEKLKELLKRCGTALKCEYEPDFHGKIIKKIEEVLK